MQKHSKLCFLLHPTRNQTHHGDIQISCSSGWWKIFSMNGNSQPRSFFLVLESGTGGGCIHQKLDAINRVLEYSKRNSKGPKDL